MAYPSSSLYPSSTLYPGGEIAASADPLFSPPRNQINLTAVGGTTFQSGILYRVQYGIRTTVRQQPPMGQSTSIVYDYETPYGTAVTYEFVGTVVDGSGNPSSVDYVTNEVTTSPASGWIVHPLVPSLSVPISTTDRTLIGVTDIGDRFRTSTATLHQILGQSLPIISTTGPRVAATFMLTLAARNPTQSAQLEAVINDQTPLLIQFPAGSIDEWTPGFYAVIPTTSAGATEPSFGRFAQNVVVPRRVVSLPLQQVQSPFGGVSNPGWSYNSVAATYASYNAASAAYNTYADMEANNVRS